jgi:hypothetical protein
MFVRKLITLFLAACFLLFAAMPASAQTAPLQLLLFNQNTPPPDINSMPVLTGFTKAGAKLFYMGERSGLFGWFIVKDGQVQMIYVTPDKKTALIGGMFTSDGDNVTGQQITTLTETNKEVADLVTAPAKQQDDVMKAGAAPGGFAAIPGGVPVKPEVKGALPTVSLSPGERLLQDMQAAASAQLGKNDSAEIFIVITPSCPYCKATWRELRDAVMSNKVQVRLVPIANAPGSEDMRVAAQLLKASNPLEAWDKYVNGDKNALAGEADNIRLQAVSMNNLLIDKWNIQSTPYLVYRAKDGRVKIVQGKPERMPAVLSDLLK